MVSILVIPSKCLRFQTKKNGEHQQLGYHTFLQNVPCRTCFWKRVSDKYHGTLDSVLIACTAAFFFKTLVSIRMLSSYEDYIEHFFFNKFLVPQCIICLSALVHEYRRPIKTNLSKFLTSVRARTTSALREKL